MAPMKVEDPTTGEEKEVYTPEEMEAEKAKITSEYEGKLKDKDEHVAKKLEEFTKGKQSQELKDIERDKAIEETKKIAEEAKEETTKERNKRLEIEKDSAIAAVVGSDPESKKKLLEAMENIDKTKVTEISEQVKLAASMAGFNSNNDGGGNHSMSGGYAPNFIPEKKKVSDAEHQEFKDALGLGDFIPKKEEK